MTDKKTIAIGGLSIAALVGTLTAVWQLDEHWLPRKEAEMVHQAVEVQVSESIKEVRREADEDRLRRDEREYRRMMEQQVALPPDYPEQLKTVREMEIEALEDEIKYRKEKLRKSY